MPYVPPEEPQQRPNPRGRVCWEYTWSCVCPKDADLERYGDEGWEVCGMELDPSGKMDRVLMKRLKR